MRGRRDRTRSGRDVNGILLLDKPPGLTSNAALQQAKRAFKAKKAGHTGSLDPIATGLLPLCFGEATKVSSFFLGADKRYRSVFTLGSATDTGDSEGQETFSGSADVSDEAIEAALDEFRGEIEQVPPMYSAVKFQGQPLYKLARQGIEVERKPRLVTVLDVSFERLDESRVQVDLHCTSGFYVRSLAHELGERLGCGAHVSSLSRTGVAEFILDDAIPLAQLTQEHNTEKLDQLLIAMDVGLKHLPGITLSDDAAYYLCRGQPVKAAELPNEGWVRLYADEVGFLGLGEVLDDGRVAPKRLFNSPQG
jgi:tRNA pseudouridine55 synthase